MIFHRSTQATDFGQRQRGAVLFVSLMFLIIIALLAITSSGTSIMEERMTGGLRNRQLSSFSAETGLRAAEVRLWTAAASNNPIVSCGGLGGGTPLFGVYCYDAQKPIAGVQNFRTKRVASTFAADSASGTLLTSVYTGAVDLANPGAPADLSSKLASNPYVLIEDLGAETDVPIGNAGGPMPAGDDRQQHDNGDNTYGGGGPSSASPGSGPAVKHLFRITSRSLGGTDSVMRVVESTFAAPTK